MENTFGYRLKAIRTKNDWTQDELAEKLGTSKQVISRYENGIRIPKITVVDEYSHILGVSLSFLLGTDDNEKPALKEEDELWEAIRNDPIKMELAQIIFSLDHEALERLRAVVDLVKGGLQ